jgi:hypothetical protein
MIVESCDRWLGQRDAGKGGEKEGAFAASASSDPPACTSRQASESEAEARP